MRFIAFWPLCIDHTKLLETVCLQKSGDEQKINFVLFFVMKLYLVSLVGMSRDGRNGKKPMLLSKAISNRRTGKKKQLWIRRGKLEKGRSGLHALSIWCKRRRRRSVSKQMASDGGCLN